MHLGQVARRLLGPRLFSHVSGVYRRVFVDLKKVAAAIGPLGDHASILDVGGGDGALLNLLLERNRGVHVTLVDASVGVGAQVRPEFHDRVRIMGGTTLAQYAASAPSLPEIVLVSDVLHHVLPAERVAFFEDIRRVLGGHAFRLVFKDVEPGYVRTRLGGLADRYISGDPNVEFISRDRVRELVQRVFPGVQCRETDLFRCDRPNYCLDFSVPDTSGTQGAGGDGATDGD